MKRYISLLMLSFGMLQAMAAEILDSQPSMVESIQAALEHERRTDSEKDRDKNRNPKETLEFLGIEADMSVLELMPGGGWYTKILGPILDPKGKLYLSIGAERTAEKLADQPGFSSTKLIPFDRTNFVRKSGSRQFDLPEFSFGIKKLDLVLTFRNQHNFTETGRRNLNQAIFEALKKGGRYGIIDHTRRHMQADSSENWRRLDPVLVIKEVQEAGFELVDYSTLHYRLDDELRYEVGRKTVTGNTDRFTLLFRKP